jgi:asparagine synthase (glutamine-hydrolysing)
VCGIAGVMDLRDRPEMPVMKRASKLMIHRGPDEEGSFYEGPVCLLHRRLSIIDLSSGSQPMFNEDRTLVIVFNGEIYNFKHLRHQLELKGHVFRTNSDTEVVLHGYEEWGESSVEKLSGMFAFAIYNRSDNSFFLARDRCGEKPLYYYYDNGKFIFASEIQTLSEILKQNPSPDEISIYLYLRLGYIPAPYSYFKGIKKLIAGSYITLKSGKLKSRNYYQASIKIPDKNITEQELCDELDATLSEAVKKMLISDVPLGAFLSGGIDSSLIVAMMAKHGRRPDTFSISFGNASYDESSFAERVSQIIGTNHRQYRVGFENLEASLSIMDGFGEPFADSSGIPTWYLTKKTREKVTVALSGDGGDELFGGYRRYLAQYLAKYYRLIPSIIRAGMIEKFLAKMPDKDVYYADSFIKSARIFTERIKDAGDNSDLMLNTLFSHKEITSLFPDLPDGRKSVQEAIEKNVPCHPVEALIHTDRNLYLPNDIMVKVDRMSMKNSLEVRAPFLDPRVLSFSEKIPLSMKIRGKTQKYLLKKVALRYLPADIVFRKKHGFMVPMTQWLKKAGRKDIRSRLPAQANPKAINYLLESHFDMGIDYSYKLFSLIILGRYLKSR